MCQIVTIDYTNWLGERRFREIVPVAIQFGSNDYHPEPTWLLLAYDGETRKGEIKTFAMNRIHEWKPLAQSREERPAMRTYAEMIRELSRVHRNEWRTDPERDEERLAAVERVLLSLLAKLETEAATTNA